MCDPPPPKNFSIDQAGIDACSTLALHVVIRLRRLTKRLIFCMDALNARTAASCSHLPRDKTHQRPSNVVKIASVTIKHKARVVLDLGKDYGLGWHITTALIFP